MEPLSGLETSIAAMRAVHAGAAMVLFGELVFRFVDRPLASEGTTALHGRASRRRVLFAAGVLLALSGVAWLGLEGAAMSGGPWQTAWDRSILATVLGRTVFGHAWLLRAVLLVALAALALSPAARAPTSRTMLACSGALLASIAWAGHANVQTGVAGAVHHAADALHLLAAGAWVGGLAPFAARLGRPSPGEGLATIARMVRRYGELAALCVAAIVASGVVNALYTLGAPARLIDTAYGNLLLIKLALFAAMLALAAVNRWRLTPALLGRSSLSESHAARRLRASACVELALGAAVLVVAGWLGTSAPPMPMGG